MTVANIAARFPLTDERPFQFFDRMLGFVVEPTDPEAVVAKRMAELRTTVFQVADPLRRATTQDQFEAAFDLVADKRFLIRFMGLTLDPMQQELEHRLAAFVNVRPVNPEARELQRDLMERLHLVCNAADPHGVAPRPDPQAASKMLRWWPGIDEIARIFAAALSLGVIAHDKQPWQEWSTGLLWNLGLRSVHGVAHHLGMSWEAAADAMVSGRDRRLAAKPFDPDASRHAMELLGFN